MTADLENDLLVLLYDVARHMRTYADQMAQAQAQGLTRAQLIVLAQVERRPGVSQNELAAVVEVAPMTIARLVDRLEELDFLERCPDPEDRRIWRLRLTPAGSTILRATEGFRAMLHSVMTRGLHPAVLDVMTTGLRQMKENVNRQRLAKVPA